MKKNIICMMLACSLILMLVGCASSSAYIPKEQLFIDQDCEFFIDISGDNIGVYKEIGEMLAKQDFSYAYIKSLSDIPSKKTKESSGSGFFIAPSYLVTNAHVVGNESIVNIIHNAGDTSSQHVKG